jgi:acetyl esterase/lipase
VAYRRIAGVPRNATSLDIHAPAGACDAPVVVWVHGGGYHRGDKSNGMRDKAALFNRKGWILVSVNYRLTTEGDPSSARFPDHYDDVAAALAWVEDHIADYGGDVGRLALLGHSAGADIVANVAAEAAYLAEQGASADLIDCLAPLDTAGFDKPRASAVEGRQWLDALGNNPDYLTETSATLLLRAGVAAPPPDTLSVYRGTVRRQAIELDYLRAVRQAGGDAVAIDARSLTHGQVSSRIGAADDRVMTPPLTHFLRTCFTPPAGA